MGRLGAATAILVPLARRAVAAQSTDRRGFPISGSLAERFGLFTIIVLGEVIADVVSGLAGSEHSTVTTVVGLLCIGIGFGIWWNYFDFIGLRRPRPGLGVRGIWLVTHLPLSMAVGPTGAGMVSLIEHAADTRSPAGAAWLVGGSTGAALPVPGAAAAAPARAHRHPSGPGGLLAAAVLSVVTAALRPPPWALTSCFCSASPRCGPRPSSGTPDWASRSSTPLAPRTERGRRAVSAYGSAQRD